MISQSKKNPIPLIWIWLGAGAVSLFVIANAWVAYNLGKQEESFDWFFEITTVVTNYFLWAAIIPVIYRLVVSNNELWTPSLKSIVIHLMFAIVIALIHRYGALSLYVGLTWMTQGYLLDLFSVHSLAWVIRGTIPSFIQYWLIIGLLWGVRYYRLEKAKQIELIKKDQEIANARFNALKMQLHPHFFFNTLNTISSVMERDTEEAQSIVSKLAKLMRALVDSDRKEFISLESELEYIGDYLHVEKARFVDTLEVEMILDPSLAGVKVPNLILQPLVENAIKHGFAQSTGFKKLKIEAKKSNENLILSVSDNGRGVANVSYVIQNAGVGLRSVIQRLNHIYDEKAKLDIKSSINEGFSATIFISLDEVGINDI